MWLRVLEHDCWWILYMWLRVLGHDCWWILTYWWVLKTSEGPLVQTLSPSKPMTLLQMFICGSNGLLAMTISPLQTEKTGSMGCDVIHRYQGEHQGVTEQKDTTQGKLRFTLPTLRNSSWKLKLTSRFCRDGDSTVLRRQRRGLWWWAP